MGILDGKPLGFGPADVLQAQRESDVIFGCVFLGMLHDALGEGITLRWDVESATDDVTEKDVHELQQVLTAMQQRTGVDAPPVTAGWSPEYNGTRSAQVAIAAGTRPRSHEASESARRPVEWSSDVARKVEELLKNDPLMKQNIDLERGAYYGIVDAKENKNPMLLGSARRRIAHVSEGGRWNRGVPYHGLIMYDDPTQVSTARYAPNQAAGSEEARHISGWNGEDDVCGYCHGMVWAVAQAKCQFPDDGKPYELAVGKKTHKLSSCFGCSTFLHANGYAPSSMHLGRSDSWVPLPEGPTAPSPFGSGDSFDDNNPRVFGELNTRWAQGVSDWMSAGARLVTRANPGVFPLATVETSWRLQHAIAQRFFPRQVANLLLDALTIHNKDLLRLKRFVGV